MNALPDFPLDPEIGQAWGNWVWTGSIWAWTAAGSLITRQLILASGTYQPSVGLTFADVEVVGGGAGGGGALGAYATSQGWVGGGGGGASGGYSRSLLTAAQVEGGIIVTIGQGGLGGFASGSSALPGGDGGQTSFGALCVANGGLGARSNNFVMTPQNNPGGAAGGPGALGTGDLVCLGNAGQPGLSQFWQSTQGFGGFWGGNGGASVFGGATPGAFISASGMVFGTNGTNGVMGAGGSGGASYESAAATQGGNGGNGLCLITEYCYGAAS